MAMTGYGKLAVETRVAGRAAGAGVFGRRSVLDFVFMIRSAAPAAAGVRRLSAPERPGASWRTDRFTPADGYQAHAQTG